MNYANQTHMRDSDWDDCREYVLNRDGGCVICGNDDANVVHHIIPQRTFEYSKVANFHENLVLVCREGCHYTLEPEDPATQVGIIRACGCRESTLEDITEIAEERELALLERTLN